MPVNIENIKKAMDDFEAEDYISAKEILQKEIHQAKNDYLKTKLELEQDVDEACKKKVKKVVMEEETEVVDESKALKDPMSDEYMTLVKKINALKKKKETKDDMSPESLELAKLIKTFKKNAPKSDYKLIGE